MSKRYFTSDFHFKARSTQSWKHAKNGLTPEICQQRKEKALRKKGQLADKVLDIWYNIKKKEKKMSDTKFNSLMHIVFIVLFTLILCIFHAILDTNNKNVDKISEISNKVDVLCEVKTNQFLHVTIHKIIKWKNNDYISACKMQKSFRVKAFLLTSSC